MLTITIFLPLITAIIILFNKRENDARYIALTGSGLTLLFSLIIILLFLKDPSAFKLLVSFEWIKLLNSYFQIGLDGISLPIFILTSLLSFLVVYYHFRTNNQPKRFFSLLLLLETGMLGVFASLDLLLFYIFFEICLVPMYFLIGIWGEKNKRYAALKFFLYTLFGSVLILFGFIIIYYYTGTFNYIDILKNSEIIFHSYGLLAVISLLIGFAIKVPLFPFHTWLPDAHTEAPTGGSVLLAGILLKMGVYGIIRFVIPIFTEFTGQLSFIIGIFAVISIIYGALNAIAQKDLKRMIAYSSVSHMGYAILGIAAFTAIYQTDTQITALTGTVLQMISHGLITGALFFLVGMLYKRTNERNMIKLGGLNTLIPVFGGFFIIFSFASLGLPGMSGFISEFLILLGSFPVYTVLTVFAAIGLILTATYFLRSIYRTLMGPVKIKFKEMNLKDLSKKEILIISPLLIFTILIGIYPGPLINIIEKSINVLIK